MASARRHCSSAIGPRISPSTAGTSGTWAARIASDTRPAAYRIATSTTDRFSAYAPIDASRSTPAKSSGGGTRITRAHSPTSGRFRTSSITLPTYRLAIRAHTRSGCV